ncbi:hypothetical protein STCU_02061 [Strigomonas culicis]|uniref:Vesicle transport protein n=1 Tax=Strigomonas culicis TaxID=28005 RepID=S9WCD0_9TRYP|nr:hypothetical protein STCU_02061 [Strigomonas culicis]|eukprot:EPY33705.1 hypothetical protein STCU_02061 [Strigomonas culicis]
MSGRHANTTMNSGLGAYWGNIRRHAHHLISDQPMDEDPVLELPPEESYLDGLSALGELSYMQRLTGFFLVLGMGCVFLVIAMSMAMTVVLTARKFAFFFTVGNMFCLCSTCFIVGFRTQVRSIFQANRFEAGATYLMSSFLTLLCALWLRSSIGCIVFAAIQLAALLWYVLSYIPYARHTLGMAYSVVSGFLRPILSGVGSLLS